MTEHCREQIIAKICDFVRTLPPTPESVILPSHRRETPPLIRRRPPPLPEGVTEGSINAPAYIHVHDAVALFPARMTPQTVMSYITRGVRRPDRSYIRLHAVREGRSWFTTETWVREFLAATSATHVDDAEAGSLFATPALRGEDSKYLPLMRVMQQLHLRASHRTVTRWIVEGLKVPGGGRRSLRAVRIGYSWRTTAAWVAEFIDTMPRAHRDAMTHAHRDDTPPATPIADKASDTSEPK